TSEHCPQFWWLPDAEGPAESDQVACRGVQDLDVEADDDAVISRLQCGLMRLHDVAHLFQRRLNDGFDVPDVGCNGECFLHESERIEVERADERLIEHRDFANAIE